MSNPLSIPDRRAATSRGVSLGFAGDVILPTAPDHPRPRAREGGLGVCVRHACGPERLGASVPPLALAPIVSPARPRRTFCRRLAAAEWSETLRWRPELVVSVVTPARPS